MIRQRSRGAQSFSICEVTSEYSVGSALDRVLSVPVIKMHIYYSLTAIPPANVFSVPVSYLPTH